ncbi:MAG: hypothetical protein M3N52_06840, partial [Actinomycetota bacterium]|nr:hypothetical protein [Actinomycetota bacterium]
DTPGADQPVEDLEAEAAAGTGAPPVPSGAPGIEAEGRKAGADEQSARKPAAETPGMNADPQGQAARRPEETPAPGPDPASDQDDEEKLS